MDGLDTHVAKYACILACAPLVMPTLPHLVILLILILVMGLLRYDLRLIHGVALIMLLHR